MIFVILLFVHTYNHARAVHIIEGVGTCITMCL